MEILLKCAAAAVTGAVICLAVKKSAPEMALLLAICVVTAVMYLGMTAAEDITDFLKTLSDLGGVSSSSVSIVLKTVGIGIVARFAADVCRDAGQAAAASAVEFAGAVSAVFVALPLMKTVLSMISSLV